MKPLHRSFLFWLGLLPGIFLLWAWVDSTRHLTSLTGGLLGRIIVVSNHRQSVNGSLIHRPHPSASSWQMLRVAPMGGDRPGGDFAIEKTELNPNIHGRSGTLTGIAIPHYMLFLAWFLLFLIALGVWRKFRRKRGRPLLEASAT